MIIGVLREIKKLENRVSLIPSGVESLVSNGHKVLVENNAGYPSNFPNEEYQRYGAKIVSTAKEIYEQADLVLKVKEPTSVEYPLMREGQMLFTYFHFAASEELTRAVMNRKCIAIAYETIQESDGSLPLLTPSSEVAGRMAVQIGARYLQKDQGGCGVLMGGVPGVEAANVLVLGGGSAGSNAARCAAGLGANVCIMDVNLNRLRYLDRIMPANVKTMMSNAHNIREIAKEADVIISGVLLPGAKAPKLITRQILKSMRPGSVVIDVAIDQGGSMETSRPTDHESPVYVEEGIIHYCVTNMPSAVPATSTIALTNATWPYLQKLVNQGFCKAVLGTPALAKGVNIVSGVITCPGVAAAFNLEYMPLESALEQVGLCQSF